MIGLLDSAPDRFFTAETHWLGGDAEKSLSASSASLRHGRETISITAPLSDVDADLDAA
ncbi:MAG: hypothetical protein WAU45_18315 [Blastocatellia bacterium]